MLCVLCTKGLACARGGDEDIIPVVEVGIGVGYFVYAAADLVGEHILFDGRGKPGEEDNGSKAGSRDGAGRFRLPVAIGGSAGS